MTITRRPSAKARLVPAIAGPLAVATLAYSLLDTTTFLWQTAEGKEERVATEKMALAVVQLTGILSAAKRAKLFAVPVESQKSFVFIYPKL